VCLDCWREILWQRERETRYRKSTQENGRCSGKGHVEMANAQEKDIYIEQIELQAKLLNYFLGSNKSNINQWKMHDR